MPLHPQIADLVARMPPVAPDIFDDIQAARARSTRPVAPPDPRIETIDRTIPGPDGGELPIRIHRPAGVDADTGIAIWFHGGGWALGDIDSSDHDCRRLANEQGLTVLSVGYRLAPEHPFPAGFNDCYQVVRWVIENASALRIDPSRIAIGGHSAGGALAAGVALRARDDGLTPAIRYLFLGYPALDHRLHSRSIAQFPAEWLWGDSPAALWRVYLSETGDVVPAYASPALADEFADFPATYLMVGEQDSFRDEALEFADRLLGAGVEVSLNLVPGMPHMFDIFAADLPVVRRAVDAWMAAVGEHIGNSTNPKT
ncbi:MAG TPA: alpha/beta hydrolase [Galbitalea sp.]|jgi:acetyl esterase/lipase|nr:alpha/beta hydrolase [Galbitalea sp.]